MDVSVSLVYDTWFWLILKDLWFFWIHLKEDLESFIKVKLFWSILNFSVLLKGKESLHIQEHNYSFDIDTDVILNQVFILFNFHCVYIHIEFNYSFDTDTALILNEILIFSNFCWHIHLKYWWFSLTLYFMIIYIQLLEMPFISYSHLLFRNILAQIISALRLHVETIKVAWNVFYEISTLWNFFILDDLKFLY